MIFFFNLRNVYCMYSLESPRWGDSNENTQYTFMLKKIEKVSLLCLLTWLFNKSRKENPQKPTQPSPRSHPRHLVGKRTAQKDITIDITSDSQANSNLPNRRPPASSGSSYPCLEIIFMVPKVFEPLKFDCIKFFGTMKIISRQG